MKKIKLFSIIFTLALIISSVSALFITVDAITKNQLNAECFMFTAPTELIYDKNVKLADIEPAIHLTGVGEITVKYYDANGELVEAPINAGKYTVKIDVTESEMYNSITDLLVGEFTIVKKTVTVTAEDKSGCVENAIEYSYNADGFIGEDAFITEPKVSANTDGKIAGEYIIIASGAVVNDNYDIIYVDGKLTLNDHEYGEAQQIDVEKHQAVCACGNVFSSAHNDEDFNNKCDNCGFDLSVNDPSAPTPDLPEPSTDAPTEKVESEFKAETEASASSGCGSTIAPSVIAVVGIIGTAVIAKREE